jgi:hypothetical protein
MALAYLNIMVVMSTLGISVGEGSTAKAKKFSAAVMFILVSGEMEKVLARAVTNLLTAGITKDK